ncbi:MAG: MFS transporter [Rhodocyclaceae bacterium]|nr:MFS transporter [Rhodocyclaceae bacterium]
MRRGQVLRYGLLGLPLAFGALPIYLFVPDLYARSGLLGLTTIGAVLLLTRLLDAVADPCFGWLIDRHPRKRSLYVALIPFGFGFYALFTPALSTLFDPALWLFAALTCCTLGFSAAMIAYQAWGGDLGTDAVERLRLTGAREAFILVGVVTAAVIPTAVSDQPLTGVQSLPWFLGAFLVMVLVVMQGLPVGRQTLSDQSLTSRLKIAWADTTYRRLLGVFFANGVASAFPATLFVFYVTDVLQAPDKTGLLLGTYFLAAAMAVPVWVRMAQSLGRPLTWILAMAIAVVSFSGAAFLGAGDWLWFLLICIGSGIAVGTDLTIPASMVADLGEKHQAAGTYFGVWNLVAKINLALAAGIALPLLAVFDYAPGSAAHTDALVAAYVLLPLVLKCLAIFLLYRWRHNLTLSI